jgi:hypothetical protein
MSSIHKPSQSLHLLTATFIALAFAIVFSPLFAEEVFASHFLVCPSDPPTSTNPDKCQNPSFADVCQNSCGGTPCISSTPEQDNICTGGTTTGERLKSAGDAIVNGLKTGLIDISVGFVLKMLNYILYGISTVLERLVALSAFLLEMAIDVSSAPFSDLTILQDGWKIVRDVMNSFFVLILFIIAIATILQLESYAWKALLPWFIIIALLVNFSFVLSGVVIDFTNVLGRTFFDKMNSPAKLSENIAKAFNINNINNITIPDCTPTTASAGGGTTNTIVSYAKDWSCVTVGETTKLWVNWDNVFNTPSSDTDKLTKFLFLLTLRVIMLFLMIFPLLVGAAMMIMRTVMLMVLIILAPAAFAAYILPATRTYTNQWYTQLFSISFFFPSYMFILYIAIKYGIAIGEAIQNTGKSIGGTFSNLATIFNFLTMVAFMFIALSVARKSGIVGAETTLKYADAGRKWATGYAGRMTGVPRLAEKYAQSERAQRLAASGALFGLSGVAGRGLMKLAQRGAKAGGREEALKARTDAITKLAPRFQGQAYLSAGQPIRRRVEEQIKTDGIAEMMHYLNDQGKRKQIENAAFAYQPPEQRKDSQEKLKTAYADREINKQSTGQLVGRFDSKYYTKAEEEKIFDEAKTDKRAKILMRSTRDIAELEQRMLNGIGTKDVREIERTYDEIARNGVEMDGNTLIQKFNKLSKEANQKLYDIIDPGDLREKLKDFTPGATSTLTDPVERAKEQAKFDEQREFLERIGPASRRADQNAVPELGLGRNKRGVEIRKIVGAVRPTAWKELGFASQEELVRALTPAEATSMREEDMQDIAISQYFDPGQLEAIGRSQRVTPKTRKQIRQNVENYITVTRGNLPSRLPQGTPDPAHDQLDRIRDFLNRSPAYV